jgi:hypothetical protein
MNETRLFNAGNHFNGDSCFRYSASNKFGTIGRFTYRTGGNSNNDSFVRIRNLLHVMQGADSTLDRTVAKNFHVAAAFAKADVAFFAG